MVEPVEPEVVACEVEPPAPAAAHQPSDDPNQIADQGPQAMTPGAGRQQLVLHRAQQHLRELATDIEGLVGAELPARRMMQVEVDQRPLEGVLLTLLSAVAAHQLVERKVVARDQDHGVDGEQQGLAPVAAAADPAVLPAITRPRRAGAG